MQCRTAAGTVAAGTGTAAAAGSTYHSGTLAEPHLLCEEEEHHIVDTHTLRCLYYSCFPSNVVAGSRTPYPCRSPRVH